MAWNASNCQPPWSEADLRRKLERAADEPGARGRLLATLQDGRSAEEQTGSAVAPDAPTFPMAIPDFILSDWWRVRPTCVPPGRGRPSRVQEVYVGLVRVAVVQQRSSHVYIPDVIVGYILWGADRTRWPQRWQRQLWKRLSCGTTAKRPTKRKCQPGCPLHGRVDVPHFDLRPQFDAPDLLVVVNLFEASTEKIDDLVVSRYDFRNRKSHLADPEQAERVQILIDNRIRRGRLFGQRHFLE